MIEKVDRLVKRFERGEISRRELLAGIVSVSAASSAAASPPQGETVQVAGLDHVAFRVSDVSRSRQFYEKVLGASVRSSSSSSAFLGVGDDWIALFDAESRTTGEETQEGGVDHVAFRVTSHRSLQRRLDLIREMGLEPIHPSGTQRTYFRDPDGNMIQFS